MLLVKFHLPPNIMFYKHFLNLQHLIRQTEEIQRYLTSSRQKWLTAGVAEKQVKYNSLCSKKVYSWGVVSSTDK